MPIRLFVAWLCLAALAGCAGGRGGGGLPPVSTSAPRADTACISGHYHGTGTEIAAALELRETGRFRYVLIYGALDERAEGHWEVADGHVVLTSDPVVAPAFVFVGEKASPDGAIHVDLDLPDGMSRQYFDAELAVAGGETEIYQFAEDGLSVDTVGAAVESVRVLLPLFGLASEPHAVSGMHAASLRFRFEPNDLGKVAFNAEPLQIEPGVVVVTRHGRTLRLLRQEDDCQDP